jgi:hypothetical protein
MEKVDWWQACGEETSAQLDFSSHRNNAFLKFSVRYQKYFHAEQFYARFDFFV